MSSKNTKMKHFKKHEKNKNKSKWEWKQKMQKDKMYFMKKNTKIVQNKKKIHFKVKRVRVK